MIETFRTRPPNLCADIGCQLWATSTAILVSMLASTGTQVAGAVVSSKAAKNAAKLQVDASNRAAQLQYQASQDSLNFAKSVWQQQQQNMAPWLAAGRSSLGALMTGMGMPGASERPMPQTPMPANFLSSNTPPPPMPGGSTPASMVGGQPGTLNSLYSQPAPSQASPPSGAAPPPPVAQTSTQGGRVRISWPDGTLAEISSAELPQYLALGAQRVA